MFVSFSYNTSSCQDLVTKQILSLTHPHLNINTKSVKKQKALPGIKKMKLWNTRLSFIIIVIVIFAGLHFSSGGRKLPSTTAMEEFQERFRRFRFHSERMLPTVSTGEKYKQIYGVSLKKIPGGPNPLHNKWYVTYLFHFKVFIWKSELHRANYVSVDCLVVLIYVRT